MKVKQNDIKLLLFVLGILSMVCAHMLVYEPKKEDIELRLKPTIATQEEERARLKKVEADMPVMLERIEANKIIVENELQKYPEDVLPETYMMYAEDLRNQLDVTISGVTISTPSLLSQISIKRSVNEVDTDAPIASYLTTLSFGWEFSYAQLKSFIEYVHADRERTVVNNLTMGYNASTGQLSGNSVINKYFIVTPNYRFEDVTPDIPLGEIGTDNPFGTVVSSN